MYSVTMNLNEGAQSMHCIDYFVIFHIASYGHCC